MNKRIALLTVVSVTTLSGTWYAMRSSDSASVSVESGAATLMARITSRSAASVNGKDVEGDAPAAPSTGTNAAKKIESSPELEKYALLKNKVSLTDQEQAQRAALIEDRELIASLTSVLQIPAPPGSEEERLQNEALDLLFEAQQSERGAQAANEVLRGVIEDNRIEDQSVDLNTRRLLGGLKAEVLYHWSARDPLVIGDIRAWLPGPVSAKVWENVVQAQRRNQADSATELE